MIKAEELRISNWIESIHGKFQVEYISNFKGEISVNGNILDKLNPIPLTPEILEKAGFKKMEEPHIYGLSNYRYYVDCGWFYILSEQDDEILLNDEITYLHHLQNLYFALTQTELTLTL